MLFEGFRCALVNLVMLVRARVLFFALPVMGKLTSCVDSNFWMFFVAPGSINCFTVTMYATGYFGQIIVRRRSTIGCSTK